MKRTKKQVSFDSTNSEFNKMEFKTSNQKIECFVSFCFFTAGLLLLASIIFVITLSINPYLFTKDMITKVLYTTDKRTDVWSLPSCIYTQIFSSIKTIFSLFLGHFFLLLIFYKKGIMQLFSVDAIVVSKKC